MHYFFSSVERSVKMAVAVVPSAVPAIRIASIFGMILSTYALYVEHMKGTDEMFEAWCDINSWMSCSA